MSENRSTVYKDEMTISLTDIFDAVKHHLILIFMMVLLALGVAFAYLKITVPQYESSATIMVTPLERSSSVSSLLNASSLLGSQGSSNISTEVQLLTSRKSLDEALSNLDLTKYTNRDGIRYSDFDPALNGSIISDSVKVNVVKDTNVVSITVTDSSPEFARDFTNALAKSFSNMLTQMLKNSTAAKLDFVQSQIPANTKALKDALDRLARFQVEESVIGMTEDSKVALKLLSYLSQRRESLLLEINEADNQLSSYDFSFLDNDAYLIDESDNLSLIYRELLLFDEMFVMLDNENLLSGSTLERNNKLSQQIFTSKTELLRYIRDRFSSLSLTQSEVVSLSNCYVQKMMAGVVIKEVDAEIDKYNEKVAALPMILKEQGELERDVEIYQALSIKLSQMLEEAKLLDASIISNVTKIDEAELPLLPVSPKPLIVLAAAFLLGGFVGLFLAVFIELRNQTIESITGLKEVIKDDILFLGWIPLISEKLRNRYFGCVVFNEPLSLETERYKLLASNLIFGNRMQRKTIVVSSSNKNFGKTSVMCNIAASLATSGYRVLLMDGDLRMPSCEAFFGYSRAEKGLVDVLFESYDYRKCLIAPQENMDLYLLPPGTNVKLPSLILKSGKFAELLAELEKEFDYILIDAPPLLYASELLAVAKVAKDVMIVSRAGIDTKTELSELIDSFKTIDVNILGVCINGYIYSRSKNTSSRYGYGYGYGDKDLHKAVESVSVLPFLSRRSYYRRRFQRDLRYRIKMGKTTQLVKPEYVKFVSQNKEMKKEDKGGKKNLDTGLDYLSQLETDDRARGGKSK